MNVGWQDVVVALIVCLAVVFLYRHFRPRRSVVTVIRAGELRVRKPRPPSEKEPR